MRLKDWFITIFGLAMWFLGVAFCVRVAINFFIDHGYIVATVFSALGALGLAAFIVAVEEESN